MAKLWNPELIWYKPNIQVHASSWKRIRSRCKLRKEAKFLLSLLHTKDTNNKKWQENTEFSKWSLSNSRQKDVQHKNVNMDWDYRKFPINPVASETPKWGDKIIFFCINITGLIQNVIKVFDLFVRFHVRVQPVLPNLINIGYQIFLHHLHQGMRC